jgi:hypothetical protein
MPATCLTVSGPGSIVSRLRHCTSIGWSQLSAESGRYLAAYVLFNQAVADHLGQ